MTTDPKIPVASPEYQHYHATGKSTIALECGGQFCLEASGDGKLDLSIIRCVSIRNIEEIESHAVNTFAGSRSHVVRFINGGLLQYGYNNAGDVIELSSSRLQLTITPENDLIFTVELANFGRDNE